MVANGGISRSSMTINSIWKVRGRRPTLRRTCKVYIPRDLRELDTLRLPATYEEDHFLVQKLKAFTRHKLHHCILVALISVYIYAGAVLFQHLDKQCHRQELEARERGVNVTSMREELVEFIITNVTKGVEEFERDKVRTVVQRHEEKVVEYYGGQEVRKELSIQSAIFFCFTVITTIGYGNIHPCTDTSRVITTVYACFGVPLMILVLADLGKLSTKAIKLLVLWIRMFYMTGTIIHRKNSTTENKPLQYMTVSWRTVTPDTTVDTNPDGTNTPKFSLNKVTTLTIHNDDLYKNLDFLNPDEKNHKHVEVKDDFNLPITLAIALVMVYMVAGGFLFSSWEKWSIFEAFYFVFISMTTIGFGDYAPKNEDHMMGAFAYLVFGLMLTSMCINVIREKLTVTFQKARVRIGNSTVLNVGALLEDEDHRSRAHEVGPYASQKYNNDFGYKMGKEDSPHNSGQVHSSKLYPTVVVSEPDDDRTERLKNELSLKISQHRFTFYDSPYTTIQDENNAATNYPRKYHFEELSPESLSKEVALKIPQHRFTFYDSPYTTIQDETEAVNNYTKKYQIPDFPLSNKLSSK